MRQLIFALATKLAGSNTELVAQAVGNALYGCQMMTSDHEEVRYLLQVLSVKVNQCTELLEAQNVGNALYGLRGMGSDYKEGEDTFLSLFCFLLVIYASVFWFSAIACQPWNPTDSRLHSHCVYLAAFRFNPVNVLFALFSTLTLRLPP